MARRCIIFSNVGSMDEYLKPFGDKLINTSFLGPFSNFDLPTFWISGYIDKLTININQICENQQSLNVLDFIEKRVRYNLLE
jgi:NRPS condensation-like uncharacterized protein